MSCKLENDESILVVNWAENKTIMFYDVDKASAYVSKALSMTQKIDVFFGNIKWMNMKVTLEKPDPMVR